MPLAELFPSRDWMQKASPHLCRRAGVCGGFDEARSPKIVYRSGSLEDSDPEAGVPGIREKVCKILEGEQSHFSCVNRDMRCPNYAERFEYLALTMLQSGRVQVPRILVRLASRS
jgi:hypothetical protein